MHFFNLTITGIANIVGKLVTGYLSDFRWVNTQALSNVLILICGIDVLCMPLFHHLGVGDYNTFVFGAVVFGFCSSYVILKTIILVELLGKLWIRTGDWELGTNWGLSWGFFKAKLFPTF